MPKAELSRVALLLLIVIVGVGGLALRAGRTPPETARPPAPASPTPRAVAEAAPEPTLPAADRSGEDLDRLPRYPGSVRIAYAASLDDRFRRTTVSYLADASSDAVRFHYQRAMADHGWDRADIAYRAGDWTYVLVDGGIEAVVEIIEAEGLVRVDLQLSEPFAPGEPIGPDAPQQPTGGASGSDGEDGDDGADADGADDRGNDDDDDEDDDESGDDD